MLQLTKRTEYGLIALVHMADREGEFVSSREICERYPLPKRLLAEVLKDLCRGELVSSQRGAQGGYSLARSADEITLGEVIRILEGAPALTSCQSLAPALGALRGECEIETNCPIRSPIHFLREHLWRTLQGISLRKLAEGPAEVAHALAPQTTT